MVWSMICVYGGLSGADLITDVFKVQSALHIVNGLYGLVAPKSLLKNWGIQDCDPVEEMQSQTKSGMLLTLNIAAYILLDGTSTGQALG